MNNTPIQTQPVSPTHPFTVNLEAQQWNAVLAALSDAPYRIAAPLVQAISEQLQTQAQAQPNGPVVAPDLVQH
jgi:hypothetical protein